MQILIYKTDLAVERAPDWLIPTTPVRLILEPDGSVGAYVSRPPAFFGLISGRPVRIGTLNGQASRLLAPALETGAALRVRVVELIPPHMAPGGRTRIAVSVWGDPDRLVRAIQHGASK